MSSFEEEALARAKQMNRMQSFYRDNNKSNNTQENKRESEKQEKNISEKKNIEAPAENHKVKTDANLLDAMFKNKEQSLILLLIILLMDEKADPSLLLALVYLLI